MGRTGAATGARLCIGSHELGPLAGADSRRGDRLPVLLRLRLPVACSRRRLLWGGRRRLSGVDDWVVNGPVVPAWS